MQITVVPCGAVVNESEVLTSNQVRSLAKSLEPKSAVRLEGSLRRLAGYVNLERQTPKDEHFHRIYRGSLWAPSPLVSLSLYDLFVSALGKIEPGAGWKGALENRR